MCGICGVYDLTGQGRTGLAAVRAMCAAIQHRGPDGDGFYAPSDQPSVAMGMRRLSIIDVAGSDQPLYNEDRSIALVFNGEIYNYKELRRTLMQQEHTFRTEGDGETIIHLYEQHGLDLFAHLRGMYAFALWDARAGRLVLAVDHIGMKPLYLSERDGVLRFASEVKALLAEPSLPRGLNIEALDAYMTFGYMIGEETLFAGVKRLPPGHALIAENGATRLHEFWTFGSDRIGVVATRDAEGEDPLIEDARRLLAESVSLHLRSDVPLGLFLSGGIDSAAVLALMSREETTAIKTFTIGYDMRTPDNELLHARRIAEHFKTEHHERVINTWLTGNALLSQDKVTMAYSLEARVPFFDPALFDFAAAVPPAIRMKRNKHVLREAMRPLLPEFALERPKKPFETPILGWFARDLRARIQDTLLDDGAYVRSLFDRPALETLLRDHFSGRAPQVEVVFRLLTLELWAQRFLVAAPLAVAAGS